MQRFLTECSFGIAHDRLVQCITDAQTFEPHWENLLSIDLSGKQLDSVARLKEFLPSLDTLKLCVLTRDQCQHAHFFTGMIMPCPGSAEYQIRYTSSQRYETGRQPEHCKEYC
jgi:hypothetical protein